MYNLNFIYENKYIRIVFFIWFYFKNFNVFGFEIIYDIKFYWEFFWCI